MLKRLGAAAAVAAAVTFMGASSMETPTYRTLDPENLLYVEVEGKDGVIVIELAADFTPGHATRIKKLAREGFYDGLAFHRVIDGFMAQGGDPKGDGTGGSSEPDLKAEFTFERKADPASTVEIGQYPKGYTYFHKGFKIASRLNDAGMMAMANQASEAWVTHCPGTAAMARSSNPDSANSQFYLTTADARFLDAQYTAWGQVLWGLDIVEGLKQGEPVPNPDRIKTMRVAADLPEAERLNLKVMDPKSARFQTLLDGLRNEFGALPDICDIEVPVHIEAADAE